MRVVRLLSEYEKASLEAAVAGTLKAWEPVTKLRKELNAAIDDDIETLQASMEVPSAHVRAACVEALTYVSAWRLRRSGAL